MQWHPGPFAALISLQTLRTLSSRSLPPHPGPVGPLVLLQYSAYRSLIRLSGINETFADLHQHTLDTILQSDRAGITSSASASQFKQHLAILKASELDVSTILLNSRPDSRIQ